MTSRSQIWDGTQWVGMTGPSSIDDPYTDDDARAAVAGIYLPLTGGTLTGPLVLPSVAASGSIEGPLRTYFANSSGIIPLSVTPVVIGRFTVPVTGKWLISCVMQANWANLTDTNALRVRIMVGSSQWAYGSILMPIKPTGSGILTGLGIISIQWMSQTLTAGTVVDIDAATFIALVGSSPTANATDLDWSAVQADAVEHTPLGVWIP